MKTATGEVTDKVAIHGIEAKDPNKKSHLDMIIPSVIDSDTGILHKRALVRLALELRAYGVVIDPKKYSDVIYTLATEYVTVALMYSAQHTDEKINVCGLFDVVSDIDNFPGAEKTGNILSDATLTGEAAERVNHIEEFRDLPKNVDLYSKKFNELSEYEDPQTVNELIAKTSKLMKEEYGFPVEDKILYTITREYLLSVITEVMLAAVDYGSVKFELGFIVRFIAKITRTDGDDLAEDEYEIGFSIFPGKSDKLIYKDDGRTEINT